MSSGGWCAMCTDYAAVKQRFNLDKPLVIGEFKADTSVDALARFDAWYDKGYAGGWPWSLFPDHTNDNFAVDLADATTFAPTHNQLGPTVP